MEKPEAGEGSGAGQGLSPKPLKEATFHLQFIEPSGIKGSHGSSDDRIWTNYLSLRLYVYRVNPLSLSPCVNRVSPLLLVSVFTESLFSL
jgi:hypothetical protein